MSKKKSANDYIIEAIKATTKANSELAKEVEKQGKILELHSKEIGELQEKVQEMRDKAIIAELRFTSGKEVAKKYNLTPGRISQINKNYNT